MFVIINLIIDIIASSCDPIIFFGSLLIGIFNANIRNLLITNLIFGICLGLFVFYLDSSLGVKFNLYLSVVQALTCIIISSITFSIKKWIKK